MKKGTVENAVAMSKATFLVAANPILCRDQSRRHSWLHTVANVRIHGENPPQTHRNVRGGESCLKALPRAGHDAAAIKVHGH